MRGVVFVRDAGATGVTVDTAASAWVVHRVGSVVLVPPRAGGDGVAEWAQSVLRCPLEAIAFVRGGATASHGSASLETLCNSK